MTINSLFEGQRVRLTAVTDDDLPLLTRWYQDSVFHRLYDATPAYPHQQENRKQWLEERQKEKDAFIFALRTTGDNRFIGWAGIDGITWTHRSAWLSIAIGDPAKRGQGLGHEAMSLLLNFAFDELNLHRVQLTVFAYNPAPIRLYEHLGFRQEGIFREFLERDGKRHDMILYGLLASEWRST